MVEEFGLTDGDIYIPKMPFIADMKYLCGEIFTVREMYEAFGLKLYHSQEDTEGFYNITASMLEPAFVEDWADDITDIDLSGFLQ